MDLSKKADEDYVRIIFLCKFCSAPHIYPNADEWIHESKLHDLLSGPTYPCPGNQERLLTPHFEIQDGTKVIDQFDILCVQILNYEDLQVDEQILIDEEIPIDEVSEQFLEDTADEQLQIEAHILMDIDKSSLHITEPMDYKHSDPDIAKMQIRLGPKVQNLSTSDAKAMSIFVENYIDLNEKARKCDSELSDEISEIITSYARGASIGRPPDFIQEFTQKHLEPYFGEYIRNISKDYSESVIYSQLPVDVEDTEWEHIINGVSWSWKEIVWFVRWSNVQIHQLYE